MKILRYVPALSRNQAKNWESLAFATEPVMTCLADVIDDQSSVDKIDFSPVEIKYGLYQLCNSLMFLHREAKIVHGNISPNSIVIDAKGTWKLFGFDFCCLNSSPAGQSPLWNAKEPDRDLAVAAQPNLDYLAPEFGRNKGIGSVQETNVSISPSVDLYSLGCLIVSLFNEGKPPVSYDDDFEMFYKRVGMINIATSRILSSIPEGIRDLVYSLLSTHPEQRPELDFITQINYFEDPCVKTLIYLDTLFQRENLHKSQFFRSLPDLLPQFSTRIKLCRIVPCLDIECKGTPAMVPFILPSLISIAKEVSSDEYDKFMLPGLRGLMKMTEPVQVSLLFLKNLESLLDKSSIDSVKCDLTPLVARCLDQPSLAEACLAALPKLSSKLDFPILRSTLLPKIKKLCMDSDNLSLRVQGLLSLAKILDHLDKWTVLDEVLPLLNQLPGKNQSAIIMACVGIYRLAFEQPKLGIPKEYLATKVLPALWPMTVEPGLNLVQLEALIQLIRDMSSKVETAQKLTLKSSMDISLEHKKILDETFKAPNGLVQKPETISKPLRGTTTTTLSAKDPSTIMATAGQTLENPMRSSMEKPARQPTGPTLTLPPAPAPMKLPPYTPKDLTSSLINSNLKNLSLSHKPTSDPAIFSNYSSHTSLLGSQVTNSFVQPRPVFNQGGFEDIPLLGSGVAQPNFMKPNTTGRYMPLSQNSNNLNSLSKKDMDDLLS
ncbi:SCY1-like protein 2 isoform X2 [Artemia franciscana]|uniref:SCY1-like protein 2 isoform X2 n=1 Tax=Artemia franciscana TaxID=6661 RepID=UPI0032DBD9C9